MHCPLLKIQDIWQKYTASLSHLFAFLLTFITKLQILCFGYFRFSVALTDPSEFRAMDQTNSGLGAFGK